MVNPGNELTWQAAANLNLLNAAKKKQSLLGRKQSRSGCLTCKIRRVKCDETRPSCNRCTSTGRTCDGYPVPVKPKRVGNPLMGIQLSQALGLNAHERRTFDYFLSCTAPRLAGSLDKDFWCGQVLQFAHTEPVIRDALLAISTLYEHPQYMKSFHANSDYAGVPLSTVLGKSRQMCAAYNVSLDYTATPLSDLGARENLVHPSVQRSPIDLFHADALKHYNRSIQRFKEGMASGVATPILALLSCVLFICIEIVRDDVFAALSLFKQGKNLLSSFPPRTTPSDEKLFVTVKLMLARLGVLAAVFGSPDPLDVPPEFIEVGKHRAFASMSEARTGLYALMAGSHDFIREAALHKAKFGITVLDEGAVYDTAYLPEDPLRETGEAVLPGTFHVRSGRGTASAQNWSLPGLLTSDFNSPGPIDTMSSSSNSLGFSSACERNIPDLWNVPELLLASQNELEIRLGQWLDAFQWVREADKEAASSLMMHYHVSFVWQTTRLSLYQEVFDNYTFHFREITRHAEQYIKFKTNERPITFEIGCIPPLYFVATKCRIPSIRRHALELLLKAPRKECMWGAQSVAELAACVIMIEEEDLASKPSATGISDVPMDDTALPSECARIHSMELMLNRGAGRHELRVTRYPMDTDGRRTKSLRYYSL